MARITGMLVGALFAISIAAVGEGTARGCGCFAPPDPVTSIVQAGERIVFSVENGQVTAHIQIQYSGDAKDFGWLLPLPAVPTLEIGSEELFATLEGRTAPRYVQEQRFPAFCNWPAPPAPSGGGGCCDLGQSAPRDMSSSPPDDGMSPLVVQDSIGPYDFAVLKADDKTAMLAWLAQNRYLVPTGTDSVLTPYIHPGAYFLALKLKSGQSTGDIQPVVLHYASDLPMIPLVLTSVTSAPVLDVTAYLLGPGRAIPRNYHHVVLDDAALDWDSARYSKRALPSNYMEQVRAATLQAPGHHAFVTERAEQLSKFAPALFSANRFGNLDDLRKITEVSNYLGYLRSYGYTFTSTLVGVLAKHIAMPPDLTDSDGTGTRATPANYFYNFEFWHGRYPEQFVGVDLSYDPVALTNEIEEKVVKPVRKAAALFDAASRPGVTLTRLFTRLAPADMNSDPVFSFNPSLGPENGLHSAILQYHCDLQPQTYVQRLTTEEGFVIDYRSRPKGLPAALRIEILREAGLPEVLVDNRQKIIDAIGPLPALPVLPPVTEAPKGGGGGGVTGYGCAVGAAGGTGQSTGWRTVAAALAALALVVSFTCARRRARRISRR